MDLRNSFLVGYPVSANASDGEEPRSTPVEEKSFPELMRAKLDEMQIPHLELRDVEFEEAIDFLCIKSHELDEANPVVDRGMSLAIRYPIDLEGIASANDSLELGDLAEPQKKKVSLIASNLNYTDILNELCEQAGMEWKVGAFGAVIFPAK